MCCVIAASLFPGKQASCLFLSRWRGKGILGWSRLSIVVKSERWDLRLTSETLLSILHSCKGYTLSQEIDKKSSIKSIVSPSDPLTHGEGANPRYIGTVATLWWMRPRTRVLWCESTDPGPDRRDWCSSEAVILLWLTTIWYHQPHSAFLVWSKFGSYPVMTGTILWVTMRSLKWTSGYGLDSVGMEKRPP